MFVARSTRRSSKVGGGAYYVVFSLRYICARVCWWGGLYVWYGGAVEQALQEETEPEPQSESSIWGTPRSSEPEPEAQKRAPGVWWSRADNTFCDFCLEVL